MMRTAIKTISQHPYYGPEGDSLLFVRWLPQLSHPSNAFRLNVDEIILLIHLSMHYSKNSLLKQSQQGETTLRLIFETLPSKMSTTIRKAISLPMLTYLNRTLSEQPRALSPFCCLGVFSRKRSRSIDERTVSVDLSQSSTASTLA